MQQNYTRQKRQCRCLLKRLVSAAGIGRLLNCTSGPELQAHKWKHAFCFTQLSVLCSTHKGKGDAAYVAQNFLTLLRKNAIC